MFASYKYGYVKYRMAMASRLGDVTLINPRYKFQIPYSVST